MFSSDVKNDNRLLVEKFSGLLVCILPFVTLSLSCSLKCALVAPSGRRRKRQRSSPGLKLRASEWEKNRKKILNHYNFS